jgi:hypothetical protein
MRAILRLLFVGVVGGLRLAAAPNRLPPFNAERLVNSAPLTAELLRGKVVLVDVWEYTASPRTPGSLTRPTSGLSVASPAP